MNFKTNYFSYASPNFCITYDQNLLILLSLSIGIDLKSSLILLGLSEALVNPDINVSKLISPFSASLFLFAAFDDSKIL